MTTGNPFTKVGNIIQYTYPISNSDDSVSDLNFTIDSVWSEDIFDGKFQTDRHKYFKI
jgi:hypothetical protein